MKGIIFTTFADMVEETYGIEAWDQLLSKTKVKSKGVYVAGLSYPDQELYQMLSELSEWKNVDQQELIRSFGIYLFNGLIARYPQYKDQQSDFFGFLKSVRDVIHVDVKKLYEQATVPVFHYEQIDSNCLHMKYISSRKLCVLAEGLIAGAAVNYGVHYQLKHSVCMHQGADHCLFEITVYER